MKRRRHVLLILGLIVVGCGGPARTRVTPAEPLRIAAASDLQQVMPTLLERFKALKGVDVSPTFGASGQLSQQIKQGAPFDVYLSANRKFVDDLAKDGSIDVQSVKVYALGRLALIVRDDVEAPARTLDDLKDPAIKRFAIANPETAPYGAAAKQALLSAGLWDVLEPKKVQSETVRQALQFVQSGNVEAALVATAMARVDGVRSVMIDPKLHDPIVQALGVVGGSRKKGDASEFARFLTDGEGRTLLREAGFHVDMEKSTK